MSTPLLIAALLALAPQEKPKPEPAPWGALFSADAAMKVAFDKVCLTAVAEGRSIEDLALANHMLPVPQKEVGAGPQDKVWRLASLGQVYVVAWADGSCTSSSERGDGKAMTGQVLAFAAARGIVLAPGKSDSANNGGRRDAWCSPAPNPYVLAVTTRADPKSRRPAILTTIFRARAADPGFCRP